MKSNRTVLFLVIFVLTASSLACSISLGGTDIPTKTPPTSTPESSPTPSEIVQTEQAIKPTAEVTPGEFKVTITEAQLTDYINEELQKQTDPIIDNPSVILRDGVVELYGQVKSGFISGNAHLVVQVTIDQQGDPQISISSADLGGVPIPTSLLNIFSGMIQESLTSNLGAFATGYKLTEIHVADGLMVIKGVQR